MNKKSLYPLQFDPLYKYRMWGGDKLKTVLNKEYTESSAGESWEISNVSGFENKVTQGPLEGETLKSLSKMYGADFLGHKVFERFGTHFPLLIKYIDATKPLSIQVHPNDELAKRRHDSSGKSEMWYIMEAEEKAQITIGFDKKVTPKEYKDRLENSTITSVLHKENVTKGDTFYIPSGRVHAIGAGILLAEIQQTSDVTYRIYDYDRIDARTGKKRELHTNMALDAIDFKVYDSYKTAYKKRANSAEKLVHNAHFKTNIIKLDQKLICNYTPIDSFIIFMVVDGDCTLQYKDQDYIVKYGSTILLPATIKEVVLIGEATLLEIHC